MVPGVMVSVRPPASPPSLASGVFRAPRLNLLLSAGFGPGPGGWAPETWAEQLPRLLEPMGVHAYVVHSGREAAAVVRRVPVHLAVVDLSLPMDAAAPAESPSCARGPAPASGPGTGAASARSPLSCEEAGCRLLELLGRQPTPPPTIVIKPRRTMREDARALMRALHAGAFAVIDRPVHLEAVLDALRRALRRHYADRWPGVG